MDENLPMTKHTVLTSNVSAQNVIHRASNCYFVHASSTLYLGTVTICYPTTEKNHPVSTVKVGKAFGEPHTKSHGYSGGELSRRSESLLATAHSGLKLYEIDAFIP